MRYIYPNSISLIIILNLILSLANNILTIVAFLILSLLISFEFSIINLEYVFYHKHALLWLEN